MRWSLRGLLVGFDPALVRHALDHDAARRLRHRVGDAARAFGGGFALRLVRQPVAAACVFIAGLGYAVPGTVLALGLLSPLVAVDEAINAACTASPAHTSACCSPARAPR